MLFTASALYCGSCTASGDFRGIDELYRAGILLPVSRSVLHSTQHVCFCEIVRGCTFDIPLAYLALRGTVEVDLNSDDRVGCFPYSVGEGVVCNIPIRESPRRKHYLDNAVVSICIRTVKGSFLADLFIFA